METQENIKEKTFIVTQFIHPNHFILYNPYLKNDKSRIESEEGLEDEIKLYNTPSKVTNFKKSDIVAFYFDAGKRYIKCEVDDIKIFNGINHYFLFALDYGVSIYTTKPHELHAISQINKFKPTPIMNNISLGVLPVSSRFDYIEDKEVIYFHNIWCELAMKIFRKSVSHGAIIEFEPSKDLPDYKGFTFGDLIITTYYGIRFSLCELLVTSKVAKYPTSIKEFTNCFDKLLERDIERWNDNKKAGGILNMPEGKLPLYYEDEIVMKQYVINCEAIKCRMTSVQKVLEWQNKNEAYEHVPDANSDTSDDIDWGSQTVQSSPIDDEGFDETFVNPKRRLHLVDGAIPKKVKQAQPTTILKAGHSRNVN